MKKLWITVFLLVSVSMTVFSAPTDEQIRQAANTLGVPFNDLKEFAASYQTKSAPAGAIQISAKELYEAYKDNQLKADGQYTGKVLQISGTVDEVKKDGSKYYIALFTSDYSSWIWAYIKNDELSKIVNVSKGQQITVAGTGGGFNSVWVSITDAYLVK
jgi:hypothetical protein